MLFPLDELEILAIVDNELDPISPAPPIVEVSGRLGDVALQKGQTVHDRDDLDKGRVVKKLAMEQLCCAAHGLSLMIVSSCLKCFGLFQCLRIPPITP
jgi:7,8-dihydropterin-6-yl-methyl-4-(beta-D-ribofuranosyl)aminobenzene 5'-phosphate synthase